ncbi:MAG: HNH endonuclease [Anaerolineae bacterium]|nr:HNH endonuclease [Anaerolineae bacterium]
MTYISAVLRREVIERASNCCEYCRISRADHVLPFEIDHIISEKHRGKTELDNLCLSCWDCNHAKGSDIASVDSETGKPTFLFHPRLHNWNEHFRLEGVHIIPLTPEGRVTEFLLQLNKVERLQERAMLITLGRYPCTG